ncbi:hypothetical protein WANG_1581 [Lactobacillus kefiranofaciens subsp. kefiranofaciens]|nr:hypothetical protein WANG_1581 [Lactobacillus kefiranofaciens subsp. kefiranofaciens]
MLFYVCFSFLECLFLNFHYDNKKVEKKLQNQIDSEAAYYI